MKQLSDRVQIRLNAHQMLCLEELTEALGVSYSLLIRAIIGDFLTRNEDALERIKLKKNGEIYADTTETEEDEEESYF